MKELEKKIEEAAHENYPYGSHALIGSKDRSLYEHKNESFIAGAKSPEAKALWQEGMYTEKEVVEILYKYNAYVRNQAAEDNPVNTIEFFELNKKK